MATVPRESGDPVPPMPIISNEAQDKDGALDRVPEGPGPFLQIASGDKARHMHAARAQWEGLMQAWRASVNGTDKQAA